MSVPVVVCDDRVEGERHHEGVVADRFAASPIAADALLKRLRRWQLAWEWFVT